MTNVQIITNAKNQLIADGKLNADETIHTYKKWKELGYQVYRGEKAIVALNIWQFFQKNVDDEDEEKQPEGKMRVKKAYFFSTKQVFKIEEV